MIPGIYWGIFAIQSSLVILLFVHSNMVTAQKGVCTKTRIEIPQNVSLKRQVLNATSTTKKITKFIASHFFRQSKFQFKRSSKAAFCEQMSHWS
jgi:hypothetical protein